MADRDGAAPAVASQEGSPPEHQAGPARRVGRSRRGRALQVSTRRAQAAGAALGSGPSGGGRGRGRGRKRRREPEPPPPEPEAAEEEEAEGGSTGGHGSGEESGSEGTSDDNSDRSDAAAAAQPPGQLPPAQHPQLSVREQAQRLLLSMGLPADRAEQALGEAEEKAEASFTDPLVWAEEAQILLACRVEFEAERDDLAEAMDVSLREEQERKQAETPLLERPDEQIRQDFADSQLLQQLLRRASLASLLSPPLREQLLEYLQLEKRCKKWYCIACHFFEAAARQLAALLDDGSSEGSDAGDTAGAAVAAAAGPEAAQQAAAAGQAGGGQAASGAADQPAAAAAAAATDSGSAQLPAAAAAQAKAEAEAAGQPPDMPPIHEDLAAVLTAELFERRAEIERAVFSMPADGDGSAAVPQLFSAAVPPGAEVQCVEDLISDDEEGEEEQGQGQGGCGSQQQQRPGQQEQAEQQQQQQQQQQPAGE